MRALFQKLKDKFSMAVFGSLSHTGHSYVALALCILGGRFMVRGMYADIYRLSCWILIKYGVAEYKE